MTTESLAELLDRFHACREAREWAQPFDTLADAWAVCERADWMLWLAGRMAGDRESAARKRLVLCACACARTALQYVPADDRRPLRAIETAEAWARGDADVTLAKVRADADDASAAAYAADAADASAAAYAAYAAAYATHAAAYAAYAADSAAAACTRRREVRAQHLKTLADVVREHYPESCASTIRSRRKVSRW